MKNNDWAIKEQIVTRISTIRNMNHLTLWKKIKQGKQTAKCKLIVTVRESNTLEETAKWKGIWQIAHKGIKLTPLLFRKACYLKRKLNDFSWSSLRFSEQEESRVTQQANRLESPATSQYLKFRHGKSQPYSTNSAFHDTNFSRRISVIKNNTKILKIKITYK